MNVFNIAKLTELLLDVIFLGLLMNVSYEQDPSLDGYRVGKGTSLNRGSITF